VLNNAYWTVYCINKVHKQIEILDHQNWEQKDDKNQYHTTIFVQICGRLNNVLQMFVVSSFPDISNWTFPYISVPTQNPRDDCAFFCMLYLEDYNGRDWEMDIQIDKVSWHFISTIFFLLSIPIHSFMIAICHSLHFLIMHLFLLCFDQDRAHEYRTQFLHYLMLHRLNQVPSQFPDFIQQFVP
jgi:hypothetical protein